MAFLSGPVLPNRQKTPHPRAICAQYLSPDGFNVDFSVASKKGNFGAVFFGQYIDPDDSNNLAEIVVKCPQDSSIGRQLYDMEKYTNNKLSSRSFSSKRFADYLGEIILPPDSRVASGLARLGLVWRFEPSGDTLEDYLSPVGIGQLATILGTTSVAKPVRRSLAARVLRQLAMIVKDIQSCGIVHRDVKPENILIVPNDPSRAVLKAIDFGSSCDWKSPIKRGLGLATCDPIYAAPERRLSIFKPAYRFDIYSIGLITLRVALPSLTEEAAMSNFVNNVLSKYGSFERACSAISSGRVAVQPNVMADFKALRGPDCEDLYAVMSVLLTDTPESRASADDCLSSRFIRSECAVV